MWPFGRSAQSGPLTLLARTPLKLLTRELLGRKVAYRGQTALTFIETFLFFFQRLRSLRAIGFPGGLCFYHMRISLAAHGRFRSLRRTRHRLGVSALQRPRQEILWAIYCGKSRPLDHHPVPFGFA